MSAGSNTSQASQNSKSSRVALAQKLFIGNLIFFAAGIALLFFLNNDSPPPEELKSLPVAENSLEKDAFLLGEIEGLIDDPRTLPPLDDHWIRRAARDSFRNSGDAFDLDEATLDQLSVEFIRGYRKRFEDLYNSKPAYESGFQHGLAFTRANDRSINTLRVRAELKGKHDAVLKRFEIRDEAEWFAFERAFANGFSDAQLVADQGTERDPNVELFLFKLFL